MSDYIVWQSSAEGGVAAFPEQSGTIMAGWAKSATQTTFSLPGVDMAVLSTTTFTMTVGRANYFPILVTEAITVDRLAMEVTTLQAGANIRCAIYEATVNWQPGALKADSGNLSAASTGVKTGTVAVTLPPGRYVLWTNADTAGVQVRGYWGAYGITGIPESLGGNVINQMYVAQAFAAPPAEGLDWDSRSDIGTQPLPYIAFLRRSA